jgi:hypothetical protein
LILLNFLPLVFASSPLLFTTLLKTFCVSTARSDSFLPFARLFDKYNLLRW